MEHRRTLKSHARPRTTKPSGREERGGQQKTSKKKRKKKGGESKGGGATQTKKPSDHGRDEGRKDDHTGTKNRRKKGHPTEQPKEGRPIETHRMMVRRHYGHTTGKESNQGWKSQTEGKRGKPQGRSVLVLEPPQKLEGQTRGGEGKSAQGKEKKKTTCWSAVMGKRDTAHNLRTETGHHRHRNEKKKNPSGENLGGEGGSKIKRPISSGPIPKCTPRNQLSQNQNSGGAGHGLYDWPDS